MLSNSKPMDVNRHSKDLFTQYAKKLGYDDEKIETYEEILNSVESILEKHSVRSKALEWDKQFTKLVDGKVVLPKGFEEVLYELIRENQLINLFAPEKLGGSSYTHIMVGPLTELIASYDFSLQMMSLMGLIIMDPLLRYYKDDFKPILQKICEGKTTCFLALTEPQAGSNLENIKTTSELQGDEYVINGEKIFITNGGYADSGLVFAQNIVNGKKEGTNVLLIDGLDGITPVRLEEKLGIHASPTAQLLFENVTVPKEFVVSEVGNGYKKVLEGLRGMRTGVSFQAVAATKRAYQLAVDYANTREQFKKLIISYPDIQRKLHMMEEQIPRIEDYAYMGSYALDRDFRGWMPNDIGAGGKNIAEKTASKMVPGPIKDGIAHYYASACKLYTSEITNYLLYDAQQIFGGSGYMTELEINKIARDVRILPIYDGTSEIHNWILGKAEKATGFIPRFKRNYEKYDHETGYEKMLFTRFPDLNKLI